MCFAPSTCSAFQLSPSVVANDFFACILLANSSPLLRCACKSGFSPRFSMLDKDALIPRANVSISNSSLRVPALLIFFSIGKN